VKLPKLDGRGNQRVVDVALLPEDLVDGPCGEGRLGERPDLGPVRPRVLGQRIARGRELIGRQLVQTIDLGVDAAGRLAGLIFRKGRHRRGAS
jgi:hypothetical protein